MINIAKKSREWLNDIMKNNTFSVSEKIIARYQVKDTETNQTKSTDINVLLNRVRLNEKSESRKKLYFSAAASAGLFLFGFIIF
tara:strand:- start:257 stop:508 length:252 start_codon:yes stop_codon:yes gene_type:complete